MTADLLPGTEPGARTLVADLRARIERRHLDSGNGLRGGVVVHEVPHGEEPRRIDSLAINFLRSRPERIVGYEIKVSRADWWREIEQPHKPDAWARYCHQWWIVAPPGIVPPDSLPDGWGLLEPSAKIRLTAKVPAATREPEPPPQWLLIEVAKKLDLDRVAAHLEKDRLVAKARYDALDLARAEVKENGLPIGHDATEQKFEAENWRRLIDAFGRDGAGMLLVDCPERDALLAALRDPVKLVTATNQARNSFRWVDRELRQAMTSLDRARGAAPEPAGDPAQSGA